MPAMAVDFPVGPVEHGGEVDVLIQFLDAVEEFLGGLINDADNGMLEGLFDPNLLPLLAAALTDAPEHFRAARAAVGSTTRESLEAHGLVGAMLDAKLGVIAHLARRFTSAIEDIRGVVGGMFEKRFLPLLQQLLDAIDHTLKSVLEAAGAAGATEEFKGLVKGALWVAEPLENA